MKKFFRRLKKAVTNPSRIVEHLIEKPFVSKLFGDRHYVKMRYRIITGKKLNLKEPRSFSEKLQWLKLYDRKDEYSKMVDKYDARKYIAGIVGEEYLIPLLGVWNSVDEIDFDSLPAQFVLKCTHDSGGVVVCRDKSNFDIDNAKIRLRKWMKRNYFYRCREWPYKNIKPRIIAEKYMEDDASRDNSLGLTDYKFYCFNGKPKLAYVSQGLEDHNTARISFLNLDWTFAPFRRVDYRSFETEPPKPINFNKMLEIATVISADKIFLRVDFYEINKKVYIGELTFCPTSGMVPLEPAEWDDELGTWLKLPIDK